MRIINYLRIKNLRFTYKLAFGFGVIILSINVLAGYNLFSLYQINRTSEEVDDYFGKIQELSDRHIDHLEWVRKLGSVIIAGSEDLGELEPDHTQCKLGKMYYGADRQQLEAWIPGLKPLFAKMEEPHKRLHSAAGRISNLFASGAQPEEIKAVYLHDAEASMILVGELLGQIEGVVEQRISQLLSRNLDQKMRVVRLTLILGMAVLFFSIYIAVIIIRDTRRALKEAINMAQQIADGDLTVDITINQDDELGQLAAALRKMQAKLDEMIGFMRLEAINFENISRELSAASVSLSEGSNEQASSLEEISSTMEQMNASIEQNSAHANKSRQVSEMAAQGIEEVSNRSVQAFEANEMIAQRIGVISDIVFQTNILALNASVEAARAGELGKGFAVVAGEVRKLADKSKEAADEISKAVQSGLQLTRESMEKLRELSPQVQKTFGLLQEIAAAGEEQTRGSSQINIALQELNTLTQHGAGSSEELAATAQNLETRARMLRDHVMYYKTTDHLTQVEMTQPLYCPVNGLIN